MKLYLIVISINATAGFLLGGLTWAVITPLLGAGVLAFLNKVDKGSK